MPTYFEILLKGVKALDEEMLSEALFEMGAQGVSQDLKFIQVAEDFTPEIIKEEIINLKAYFLKPMTYEALAAFKPFCLEIDIKEEEQKDWLEEWKKHFKAFAIVEDYWVVPSWLKSPVTNDKTIFINPGLAFGTGTHPTTQLVSELIFQAIVTEGKTFSSALDLGAGTGILCILMARLGVAKGVATEIDPMAREKCLENFSLNGIEKEFIVEDENFLSNLKQSYPIVVANIIDGVLLKLKEQIKNSFSDTLIVSGILDERNEKFKKEFIEAQNLKIEKSLRLQEWWAYVLKA